MKIDWDLVVGVVVGVVVAVVVVLVGVGVVVADCLNTRKKSQNNSTEKKK